MPKEDFANYYAFDWSTYAYSFLPDYAKGDATWYGFEQWVYQVYGDFGGLYAAEPARSTVNRVVYWQSENIRFHYPSEHLLNGTQYALEMQVFSSDPYSRSLACYGHQAALSILFELDATSSAHAFFDWQAQANADETVNIDLTLLVSQVAGTINNVSGYTGTDSMPGCTAGVCWYIINETQTIN